MEGEGSSSPIVTSSSTATESANKAAPNPTITNTQNMAPANNNSESSGSSCSGDNNVMEEGGGSSSGGEAASISLPVDAESSEKDGRSAETNEEAASGSSGPAAEQQGGKEKKRVGCAHYKRRAKFVTPCCNKLYMCRYCHDEFEEHYFNRKTVTQLICTECDTRQKVQAECEKCGVRFGKVGLVEKCTFNFPLFKSPPLFVIEVSVL